ncbi:MAG: signal peptide peptidase SppA, partial [Firmicutes bacterium]|nr:signal peptide peptidase SppA [Bacillota bacterium]
AMMADEENKGMILYVNTPGGSVFASDELYLKIREYQENTGRPVYSAMQSQATSGGYYISAPADKIFANRNCWTGSIGVTMGTFMDVSGLLEKLGIRTETITSGDNKAMGSGFEPMTYEQRAIFQSLIDEAYDQFVAIVAEGREMDDTEVRKLADGRIYTAAQALDNGLIDQIGTYEEAVADMKTEYSLEDCTVEEFYSEYTTDIFSLLGEAAASGSAPDAELIQQLMELDGKVQLSYVCEVRK